MRVERMFGKAFNPTWKGINIEIPISSGYVIEVLKIWNPVDIFVEFESVSILPLKSRSHLHESSSPSDLDVVEVKRERAKVIKKWKKEAK